MGHQYGVVLVLVVGALLAQPGSDSLKGLAELHDPTAQLDFEAVASATVASTFDQLAGQVPGRRRMEGHHWVKFLIRSSGEEAARKVVLVDWPRIDEVVMYAASTTGFRSARSGSEVRFSERPLWGRELAFPVVVPPGEDTQVYLRFRTRSEFRAPISLLSQADFDRRRALGFVSVGGFGGAVLGLSVFSLLVFVRLRHRMYLLFALQMTGFLGWWLMALGWGGALDQGPIVMGLTFALCLDIWLFARLAFTRELIKLSALAPGWDRVLASIQLIGIPLFFVSQVWAPAWATLTGVLVPILLLGLEFLAGVEAYKRGSRLASWYLTATGALLSGLLSFLLIFVGVLSLGLPVSRIAIQLGALGELFGLALVLAESIREVTRERQQALQQVTMERLGALQGLVAGVTHEINTPLGALVSSAQSMQTVATRLTGLAGQGDAKAERALKALPALTSATVAGAQRISEFVQSLKLFAQLDEAEEQIHDLHEGLDSVLALLRPKLSPATRILTDYRGPKRVRCRPAAMNQVLMSVLENAGQAIGDEGTIQVRTTRAEGYLRLEVEDDGIGMTPEQVTAAFSPRLSATGARVKLGMGLSAARGILEQAHGRITLRSTKGRGTTVRIELPAETDQG